MGAFSVRKRTGLNSILGETNPSRPDAMPPRYQNVPSGMNIHIDMAQDDELFGSATVLYAVL